MYTRGIFLEHSSSYILDYTIACDDLIFSFLDITIKSIIFIFYVLLDFIVVYKSPHIKLQSNKKNYHRIIGIKIMLIINPCHINFRHLITDVNWKACQKYILCQNQQTRQSDFLRRVYIQNFLLYKTRLSNRM